MLQELTAPIAAVYITDELDRRAPHAPDYLQEKRALQDLAARMADAPEDVLPRFVDLAMEITGGVAGGLSLYEENPAPGIFRWQYLRGSLAPFNGATTPRQFSPCGITLDRNEPVLSLHPERVYDWISNANIVVPEVLLVPLYLGGDKPLGTLWIVSDKEGHFDRGHARALTELAAFVGIALRMLRTEQSLQRALDEQQTLTMEMNHRVKNLFAMTDGMIRLSAKDAINKEELASVLSGRLMSLARAHVLVSRDYDKIGAPARTSELSALVGTILAPHETSSPDKKSRFSIVGPSVACGNHAINGVALVLHELATNAAKYGALAIDSGHVDVTWTEDGEELRLCWSERNGPAVAAPPTANGFGSTLVRTMIEKQFAGQIDYDWQPAGLVATITIPLKKLAA